MIFSTKDSSTLKLSYFVQNSTERNPQVLGVTEVNEREEITATNHFVGSMVMHEPSSKPDVPVLDLLSERALVMDFDTEAVLFEKNADVKVPIASITKLATALTFLDYNPGWDSVYRVKSSDIALGGRVYLSADDQVYIRDLFNLSLVCSSNTGANALASATGLTRNEFVQAMNKKVAELDLLNIEFIEPTGLHSYNMASAHDLAIFVKNALLNSDIRKATMQTKYSFETLSGKMISVFSTDSLLHSFPINGIEIQGGKTGFINLSGYCFVGCFKNHDGKELISVILGSPNRRTSFQETKDIVNWAYASYTWE